jgi:hypothetical protein
VGLAVIAISLVFMPLGPIDSNAKKVGGTGSISKNSQIQSATTENRTGSDSGMNLLKDFAVPIAVAIVGAIAASWNFMQAKWNGHYFANLILRELGELDPVKIKPEDGLLSSHMKKSFIHREILNKPTENKEFIFTVDRDLIYHTRQIWSAFDNNDVEEFLLHLRYLTTDKRKRLYFIEVPYDKGRKIQKVSNKWMEVLKNPEVKNGDIFAIASMCINIYGPITNRKEVSVGEMVTENINPKFFCLQDTKLPVTGAPVLPVPPYWSLLGIWGHCHQYS